jgi:hypothetical protein
MSGGRFAACARREHAVCAPPGRSARRRCVRAHAQLDVAQLDTARRWRKPQRADPAHERAVGTFVDMSNPSYDRLTADDLRHNLAIMFQPSIVGDDELLQRVLVSASIDFVRCNVTERRVRNAAAKLHDEIAPHVERLIEMMRIVAE